MPTNEQRRATAKRKLERQLERRAAAAKRQRLLVIGGAALGVVVLVSAIVWSVVRFTEDDQTAVTSTNATGPAGPAADCAYPAGAEPSKPATPPRTDNGKVPTDPPQISMSVETTQGNIGLMLDNAKAPCAVNSFISLATQKYFDDTPCHRLTTSPTLGVLQCGDPSGQGTGGPGYSFANEYPTNQYPPGDPAVENPTLYPRGTIAMANSGVDTNGSQFFLVYKDSQLPPKYTMFGTIDETGLATLDKIAAGGVAPGSSPQDGRPRLDTTLKTVQQD